MDPLTHLAVIRAAVFVAVVCEMDPPDNQSRRLEKRSAAAVVAAIANMPR